MILLSDVLNNNKQVLANNEQEFMQLLASGDIEGVKAKMTSQATRVEQALKEYYPATHTIMGRHDKIISNTKGEVQRVERVWRLPVPYQVYINEVALVFLYGQPIKWSQRSEGTDDAFAKFQQVLKDTRFDSKIRQAKRLAGAETQSALLFRVYRNKAGQPDVQIRVLARSKGDEIYTRFDQYENLLDVAWGYYTKEAKDELVYHFDIFTPTTIYRCEKREVGWSVNEEENLIGKIPIILFEQEKEWAGVENLIEREEYIASHNADTNDYFAQPLMIIAGDLIKGLPEKPETAKTLVTNDRDGVAKAAQYLTWDSAPQSKKDEVQWLQEQILNKTFTPHISLDTLKSLGNLSGKALQTVMLLADIKANRHKEHHDELLDRTASLVTSIIANVLDIKLSEQCSRLSIEHEFQNPFGNDTQDNLTNLINSVQAGIISTETAVELNPLVADPLREKERITTEDEAKAQKQSSFVGDVTGAGPQTYN